MSESKSLGDRFSDLQRWADDLQRRRPVLGFPFAVIKKYGDDQAGRHAALITYYGFLSLFPLLLLAVVIVTKVLAGNPTLRQQLLDQLVPEQFQATVDNALTTLPSGGVALAVGIVVLLFSSTGVVFSAADTLNHLAGIPMRKRFGFFPRYVRTLLVLLIMIVSIAAVSTCAILAGQVTDLPGASRALAGLGSVVVMFGMFVVTAKLLIARPVRFAGLWPPALLGAVVITLVLTIGGQLLNRFIAKSGPVYGTFGVIAGLFALIFLISQTLLYSAETAVVWRWHLWPRALDPTRPTPADARALRILAEEQERSAQHRISSSVSEQEAAPARE